ncbi:MAG TPA: SusD/RagB family nutrient-binding outer membrane lipoprotein, partial [Gemmatimonadaceae bacterium]|nr:SusD/RagB family nutrient-binding outer membrane lipoprotein [Gemmatimonadaceae bacterium]
MRRLVVIALGGLLAVGAAGCTDFLTRDGIGSDKDPNNPREATRDQLFVAAQAAQFGMQEANIGMMACLFMQQCGGVGGRFVQFRGWYFFSEVDANSDFIQLYSGGGLLDLRHIQEISEENGDRVYAGVAKVLEAMLIGLGADVFGDIPYREAAQFETIKHPAFDPQAQVYADVQALLTEAIADIESGEGDGPAAAFDLVYRGDFDKWVDAAYTLKARFYLHTVEQPNNGISVTAYQNAIAAASNGISSSANDWRAFHGSATSERNI